MQDLHRDLATRVVYEVRDDAVVVDICGCIKPCRAGKNAAFRVGCNAACDHQRNPAAGACRIKFGDAVPVFGFLKPVCIDPISTRFFSVVNPRSSGAKRCG